MDCIGGLKKKAEDKINEEMHNMKHMPANLETLNNQIQLLSSIKHDLSTEVEGLEFTTSKKRKRVVRDWIENADEKCKQVRILKEDIKKAGELISKVPYHNKVIDEMKEVDKLIEQSRFPEGKVIDVFWKEIVPLLTHKTTGVTFHQTVDDTWKLLNDSQVSSIGIYGMAGAGKTTLAKHLHDKALKDTFVYWINVPHDSDTVKLQEDIAKIMKINIFGETDQLKRAAILFNNLSHRKKFFLILDNVWRDFDMEKIGFPFNKDGCNVLITSQSEQVCQKIGCQRLVKLEPFPEPEAWDLFLEEYGERDLVPAIEDRAKKMVEKCAGLPIAIRTLGRSMRGINEVSGWSNVLDELNVYGIGQEDLKTQVLPILRYSYDRLKNDTYKKCFLYCSLYQENLEITREELISKFICEDLMDRKSSWYSEINLGNVILDQLESSCLLIGCRNEFGVKCVKMHNLMRDMAIWITGENKTFMVKVGVQLNELPAETNWNEDLEKVYLMQNNISEIPSCSSPKCTSLLTLSLRENPLRLIPSSFFEHLCKLEVIDLSSTLLVKLPDAFSDLGSLKALLLWNCIELKSLPCLEKLTELRELNIGGTSIMELIEGMENLTNLKRLNLAGVSLEMIPVKAIHKLVNLQLLILTEKMAVPLEEVESLTLLEVFEGTFFNMQDLNKFIKPRYKQLCRYNIGVGNRRQDLRRSKQATLINCSLKEIWREDEDEIGLPWDIEGLHVAGCQDIQCLVRSSSEEFKPEKSWIDSLKNLTSLNIVRLPKLISIIKWDQVVRAPPPGSFSNLKDLMLVHCNSIKKFLPRGLGNLQKLQRLRIYSCKELEEIIGEDEEGVNSDVNITLPELRHLDLNDLPKLKIISVSATTCDLIEFIGIEGCTELKKIPLFNERISVPPHLKVKIQEEELQWWNALEWDNTDIKVAITEVTKFDDKYFDAHSEDPDRL